MTGVDSKGNLRVQDSINLYVLFRVVDDTNEYLNRDGSHSEQIDSRTWFFDQIPPNVFGDGYVALKFELVCDPFFFPVRLTS